MLTCKTSLACAFALISSVSAGLIPAGIVGGDSLAQVVAPAAAILAVGSDTGSCATGLVPVASGSNPLSASPGAIGGLTTAAAGNIVAAGSAVGGVVGGTVAVVGGVVAVVASDGISALTDLFPGFTDSIVLSCVFKDIIVSPASNGIEVPVDRTSQPCWPISCYFS